MAPLILTRDKTSEREEDQSGGAGQVGIVPVGTKRTPKAMGMGFRGPEST
jgi:hypothetical protein